MRKSFTKIFGLVASASLLFSITACTNSNSFKPTHKARTSICLIKSQTDSPGSANKQLAVSMVEAQVVFGVRARVVEITANESVSNRLLEALQSGCVLMVSAQKEYLQQLAVFARGHSRMMVLFFGGEIAAVDQPNNFRWIRDDLTPAAKLAGFYIAEQNQPLTILIQNGYQNSSAIISSVREGVAAFRRQGGELIDISVVRFSSREDLAKNLQAKVQPLTVLLIAGSTYWSTAKYFPDILFIGADLQFGQSAKPLPNNVQGSIERGSGNQLLKAVAALLARDFSNSPPIRRDQTLKDALAEFRVADSYSTELQNYLDELLATE